jgi:hypothetical protein
MCLRGRYLRVACPEGLYRLTGLRRSDDDMHPQPHKGNDLPTYCNGNTGDVCITTMQDCCVSRRGYAFLK